MTDKLTDRRPRIFGDSLGVGLKRVGGSQSFAEGAKPSGWVLHSIRNAAGQEAGHDAILSTGASNDALNILAAWLDRNGREGTPITPDDIQRIKATKEYQGFKNNVAGQITTLLENGADHVYVIGTLSGPENAPNYVKHKIVAHLPGGVFNAFGINDDLEQIVADYKRAHPEMANRIGFGGALDCATLDHIHPTEDANKKIVADAKAFFGGQEQPRTYAPPAPTVSPEPPTASPAVALATPAPLTLESVPKDKPSGAPTADLAADATNERLLAAADKGEALFKSGSAVMTDEQHRHLKDFFLHKIQDAKTRGILEQVKVKFAASADGTGSIAVNRQISEQRLAQEVAVFHEAEKEAGVTVKLENISSEVLGKQGDMRNQSKRKASATFDRN